MSHGRGGGVALEGAEDAVKLVGAASELNQLLYMVGQCRGLPFAVSVTPVRVSILYLLKSSGGKKEIMGGRACI